MSSNRFKWYAKTNFALNREEMKRDLEQRGAIFGVRPLGGSFGASLKACATRARPPVLTPK